MLHGFEIPEHKPAVDPVTGEDWSWASSPAFMRSGQLQREINARRN